MPSHALVLSALFVLTQHRKAPTGRALAAATTLDRDAVLAAARLLVRRGLARFRGAELRLTLEGFAVATALAARRARRGQVLVLPLAPRGKAALRHAA